MRDPHKLAVVLFQLGGPDSLEAIEPFLYNLFSDPDIIDFPLARLARRPLARLVARIRAAKVREHYAEIGGKSPIIELTRLQARALEGELQKTLAARVFVAMRYWRPLTEEVIRELQRDPADELVLLPLYPQYSRVTGGSSRHPQRLCYQSKVGPGRWLQPMLHHTLRELAAAGTENVLVVPIAFVTDHIETLYEIDIEARAEAAALGLRRFEMTPGLNESPTFVRALADLVLNTVRPAVAR